jgi:biopolymer transport protein ExbD
MAEMITTSTASGKKSSKTVARTLHIDMTPLVDLGFLLITFFIFTTTMAEPLVTNLYMPSDGKDPNTLGETGALTVLLDKENRIYYYEGKWEEAIANKAVRTTGYNLQTGLGQLIREKQKRLGNKQVNLMLMIKPLEESTYSNVINVLDEIQINAVKRYAIMDATKEETAFVQQNGGS